MRTRRTPTPAAILVMTACGVVASPAVVRATPQQAAPSTPNPAAGLLVETLASGLDTPWDLAWGPDGAIWFTERAGRVSRVDPETGAITVVAEIAVHERGEAGLMGMAFHPDFEQEPYVYLAHSYAAGNGIENRLIRMRYEGGRLTARETLVDGIPGRGNHDGSRLVVGPDGFLYMTMGDAGNRPAAQDLGSLSGKVLRLTLDGARAPGNPFGTRVYSYGHRNPQGIVFNPETGDLYVAEHGPSTNDEVMRVTMGGDHGWPSVHGFCDGDVADEEDYCDDNDVVEPLEVWTPTVGISGLDYYGSDRIPGWNGSLLATSLRGAALWRLQLSEDGRSVVSTDVIYRGDYGRLRDVLVSPDGEVYIATSNEDGRGQPASDDDRILKITRRGVS